MSVESVKKFHGSSVALITPMNDDFSVNVRALQALVEWHIEQGSHAIVAMGTTGESATFEIQEHLDVIDKIVQTVAQRVPVIAGTGANSTTEAIMLTQGSKDVGADACLLVTPYYNKPTQEGLFLHHKAVADAVDIPQILYNVPGRTGVDMLPETVERLAAIPNIIGLKEATGDIDRLKDIKRLVDDNFILLSGDDETALEFLRNGGVGEISVTANVAPSLVAQMCEAYLAGDLADAKNINDTLVSLHKSLFVESNPIPVKWAVAQLGFCELSIRMPLTELAEKYHSRVLESMKIAGVV